jgi:predicted glutamine amidotransferase
MNREELVCPRSTSERKAVNDVPLARLGVETTNGDGFGVGWYSTYTETPAVFRSVKPAWNDSNLREVAGHVETPRSTAWRWVVS